MDRCIKLKTLCSALTMILERRKQSTHFWHLGEKMAEAFLSHEYQFVGIIGPFHAGI